MNQRSDVFRKGKQPFAPTQIHASIQQRRKKVLFAIATGQDSANKE